MKRFFLKYYRFAMALILTGFSIAVLKELLHTGLVFVWGIAAFAIGWLFAKKVLHHYAHEHTHGGDSIIDIAPIGIVIVANIIHPAIDGLALVETTRLAGTGVGLLFGLSIFVHEVVRQSALIAGLKMLRIAPLLVVCTAVCGLVTGVVLSVSGNQVLSNYELGVDVLTLFSYGFVVAELL